METKIDIVFLREEDKVCINFYYQLRERYKILSRNVGEYSNVIGIFFHEIMIYITNYFLLKISKGKYLQEVNFPYLNSNFIQKPLVINFNNISKPKNFSLKKFFNINSYKYLIENSFDKILFNSYNLLNYRKPTAGITDIMRFDTVSILAKNKLEKLPHLDKCYLVDKEIQIEFLKETIYSLFKSIQVNENDIDILVKSFINFVESKIVEKPITFNQEYLITNSNSRLYNRVLASNFKLQRKKVISFSHGFSSFLDIDEPIIGYGELTYCDYYVDIGLPKESLSEFQLPLSENKPKVLNISCKKIEKLYKSNVIKFIPLNKKTKILYVPNAFIGNERYGPFRDIEDDVYLMWQNDLLSLDLNIYIKPHPLSVKVKYNTSIRIVNNKLENTFNEFDIIILDFLGSAFALATASDKPIIYFNLGLRRMKESTLSLLKERFFWYDININEDFKSQIEESFHIYNSIKLDKVNHFTKVSSLNPNLRANQRDVISDIISGYYD